MKYLVILAFFFSFIKTESQHFSIQFYSQEIQEVLFKESQLVGKWYFLSKDNYKKTKLENLTDGKSLILKKNRKYKSSLLRKSTNGKWYFDEKAQILVTEQGNEIIKWKLHELNELGMILIDLANNEKWYFSLSN